MPASAGATNYILYFHGRGEASWTNETANGSNWTNVTFSYNGNARLADTTTDTYVRTQIKNYCNTSANACIIECYSAGCNRVLKAVDDLRAGGNSLPGLFWVEGAASAAGGTGLAEVSTTGFTSLLAKLLGQQEAIDYDMTRSAARSTYGYIQNALGVWMYQTAGNVDICKSILIAKICANKYITTGGVADGAVGMDSASGASSAGNDTNGCTVAKYSWRTYETHSPCGGEPRDHFGMAGRASAIVAQTQGINSTDADRNWSDPSVPSNSCSGTQCDHAFATTAENFSKTPPPALQQVATSVASTSSNTTAVDTSSPNSCYGHCGSSSAGRTCYCDSACTGYHDCCSDFAAANCSAVNSGI
ncbi:MAG TPA: hypothetical protein VGL86_21755 [Polyangia bacterium]